MCLCPAHPLDEKAGILLVQVQDLRRMLTWSCWQKIFTIDSGCNHTGILSAHRSEINASKVQSFCELSWGLRGSTSGSKKKDILERRQGLLSL